MTLSGPHHHQHRRERSPRSRSVVSATRPAPSARPTRQKTLGASSVSVLSLTCHRTSAASSCGWMGLTRGAPLHVGVPPQLGAQMHASSKNLRLGLFPHHTLQLLLSQIEQHRDNEVHLWLGALVTHEPLATLDGRHDRCGEVGHWARDCPKATTPGSSGGRVAGRWGGFGDPPGTGTEKGLGAATRHQAPCPALLANPS